MPVLILIIFLLIYPRLAQMLFLILDVSFDVEYWMIGPIQLVLTSNSLCLFSQLTINCDTNGAETATFKTQLTNILLYLILQRPFVYHADLFIYSCPISEFNCCQL